MKTEQELTPAQQQLWMKTLKAMEGKNYSVALSWAQLLLQSEPGFFEARMLARKVAQCQSEGVKHDFFKKWKMKMYSFFALRKIKRLIKKELLSQAMIALEALFAEIPHDKKAHHLIVLLATQWNPPLREVALLSLEMLVQVEPEKPERHLELAAFCLQRDETERPWNPARAVNAYQAVLAIEPYHLVAMQGVKNAIAFLSMQRDGWDRAKSYRDLVR